MYRKHVLLIPTLALGHIRPIVPLAAKLVHERSDIIITITLTTVDDNRSKVENELDRYFNEKEKALKENIRLLYLGSFDKTDRAQFYQVYSESFTKIYPKVYREEPVTCASGRVFPPVTRPDVIVLDPFLYEVLRTIRNVSGGSVPVLAWQCTSLNTMIRYCGPPQLGGLGNLPLKAEGISKETGKPVHEILNELYQSYVGEVIKLPGMPEMYDYEFDSHHFDPKMVAIQNIVGASAFKFFEECDGAVSTGIVTFEPEASAAYRTWFDPRPVYFLGPLLPDETSVVNQGNRNELAGSSNGTEVKAFLDDTLQTHGENSLLYMSFGSQHWPSGNGVWEVVKVILDMKIPFILSHNPARAEMPHHIQERIRASRLAVVSTWAPQHHILGHKATGWFLTHCGYNSIIEAVSHGVPMIAYPLGADQPTNAAYISATLNIAYELFETRVGQGLRPLRRGIQPEGSSEAIEREVRSVFNEAWGPDGARKRENICALAKKSKTAWAEGGEARNEFDKFLQKFLPTDRSSISNVRRRLY